jgi:hypothetical protein
MWYQLFFNIYGLVRAKSGQARSFTIMSNMQDAGSGGAMAWPPRRPARFINEVQKKIFFVLPPFQILTHFGFSRFIDFTMHLDITYI